MLRSYVLTWAVQDPSLQHRKRAQASSLASLQRDFCLLRNHTFTPRYASATSTSIVTSAAMESTASSVSQGLESSPLNFIFACSICCATFADTYEGHNETVQGLSDGINPNDRLVTKLYLSSCCHVFCGEHIEGGGEYSHEPLHVWD